MGYSLLMYAWFGLLDAATGALVVLVVENYNQVPHSLLHFLIGSSLALLPDFDLFFFALSKRSIVGVGDHHVLLPHRPILVVPIAVSLAWLLGGKIWAVITLLAVLWHFFHDSHPWGSGIAWLWPFSARFISFVPGVPTLRPEDAVNAREEWQVAYGRRYIEKPSLMSVGETVISSLAAFVVCGQLWGYLAGLFISFVPWIMIFVIWRKSNASKK